MTIVILIKIMLTIDISIMKVVFLYIFKFLLQFINIFAANYGSDPRKYEVLT